MLLKRQPVVLVLNGRCWPHGLWKTKKQTLGCVNQAPANSVVAYSAIRWVLAAKAECAAIPLVVG